MLRTTLAAIAAICTIGLISAPTAGADICSNHGVGVGSIYKTACAGGDGGSAVWTTLKDANGNVIKNADGRPLRHCKARCGGGNYAKTTSQSG